MARLTYEHTKKHEDTVKKRMLTKEDIEFLKDLQHEMNTQSTVGQRDPRYWVIMETRRVLNLEDGEELMIDNQNGDEYEGLEAALPLIDKVAKEHFKDGRAELSESGMYIDIYDDDDENVETFFDLEEAGIWLNEHGQDVRVTHYEDVHQINPGPMFLTLRDADDHLRKNDYHYEEDAHAFALTAWRDPTVERLWKLLQEIDWDKCRRAPAKINEDFENAVEEMISQG